MARCSLRSSPQSLALVVCALGAQVAVGFDTGYHADLTRAVLAEHGFGETAIRAAQVENWLVDYYAASPTAPAEVEASLARLHCDNLFSSKEVAWYWGWLSEHARAAARRAADQNDPHLLLTVIAITLHAQQDFYSHSNWVDLHPRNARGYRTETWLASTPGAGVSVYTGQYPSFPTSPPAGHPAHGDYTQGLNRDSQIRPRWDESYVFAYCAGWEWLELLRREVAASSRPELWDQARQWRLDADNERRLARDEEAALRISSWIQANGQDGHWKGNRSGYAAAFVPFVAQWTAAPDSIHVGQFKNARIQELLSERLYQGGPPPAQPLAPRFSLDRRVVLLRFEEVRETRDTGVLEPNIDTGNDADFYARLQIDGRTYLERVIQNERRVANPWLVAGIVPASGEASVRIEIWDEDGGVAGDDDRCDIHPRPGRSHLDLRVAADGALSGDATGRHDSAPTALEFAGAKPDKDRAAVRFQVQSIPLVR